MLKKCDDSYIQPVVEYIGEGRVRCFYLYIDLVECGTQKEGVGLWLDLDEDGGINGVMYRYYDTLHLFSRGMFPVDAALPLVKELDPKVVTGDVEAIKALRERLDGHYTYEESYIITADKYMDGHSDLEVTEAGEADVPEIAALMMKAEIYYTVYTYESLCEQLYDRVREGFGHLYAMRTPEGRLVATNATNAETADMAVISGLVTDPEMRGRGLGRAITASTWNVVKRAGKQGIAFLGSDNRNTLSLHRKMGYTFHGLYARLIRED